MWHFLAIRQQPAHVDLISLLGAWQMLYSSQGRSVWSSFGMLGSHPYVKVFASLGIHVHLEGVDFLTFPQPLSKSPSPSMSAWHFHGNKSSLRNPRQKAIGAINFPAIISI